MFKEAEKGGRKAGRSVAEEMHVLKSSLHVLSPMIRQELCGLNWEIYSSISLEEM